MRALLCIPRFVGRNPGARASSPFPRKQRFFRGHGQVGPTCPAATARIRNPHSTT
ncbi:predicted protein [Micromonas commoda]|uniref:Uncharacterized protein n=1 Tax=Micromonas commoda (strain RCC299 / NOUM17 / CCMP2709) TaxID=296587 RepID=C1FHW5_MICCC|nr:predicted protein [Micromonas commoda]ACO69618.1 predicted protein [Micromonas commoda]|eukprot:XP_002508360.1 predicted protein [Micromonas commoda]